MAAIEFEGKIVGIPGVERCSGKCASLSCAPLCGSVQLRSAQASVPARRHESPLISASTDSRSAAMHAKHPNTKNGKARSAKRKESGKGIWPVTYKWVAVGTLMAYTAIGSQKITLANAQETRPSPQNQTQTQAAPLTVKFDIPPGTLARRPSEISTTNRTGGQCYGREGIRDVASPGVIGVYTNAQALEHLLAGTIRDLSIHRSEPRRPRSCRCRRFDHRECG